MSKNPEKEADVKLSMDAHGVRLDVITTDDQGRRIDVEMQMRDEKNIPRRMRYYEGSIDQATLEKGQNYNRLGDVVILFITPFDPFDAHGYYKYTFRNTCQEDKEIVLDDGVTKEVHIARRNARWRKEYMDWEMTLRNEREKGREEGREEGLKEGREEGRMEERIKTEEQRKRAEAAEERADVAEERIRKLEEQIALLEKGNH